VIIGPDLIVRDGQIQTVPSARAKTDKSLSGFKKLFKTSPEEALRKAELIIKNTYRTLMPRGQKGCYIYCTDPETNAYFKTLLQKQAETEVHVDIIPENTTIFEQYPGLRLPLVAQENVDPYVNAAPIFDLQIAAGQFSKFQDPRDYDWVELPDFISPNPNLFVAQVVGESMNKRIPNGSWCLFRKDVGGSRQGRVILAQHHEINDEDLGGQYTVKLYHSEKTVSPDDEWMHTKITLKPDTTTVGYDDIIISDNDAGTLIIIAEFVAVL
jgi:phage repressor protein C with HTH and peptisase S24 domain